MIDKTGNPSVRRVGSSPEQKPAGLLSIVMDRVAFCCLLFAGLLNPLLSLPVPDTGEKAPQLPGEATVFISSRWHSGGGRGFRLKGLFCKRSNALKRAPGALTVCLRSSNGYRLL